ncbi:MAG: glycosyltransferase family 4 protein [Anaerolineae bacterium]
MNIALITPGFSAHPDDWAIPALQNLARCLAQRHTLHLFSLRYPAVGVYRFDGLTHHAIGGGQRFGAASLKCWLDAARAVIRQHRRAPFHLLHAFWADEAGFSAALAGALIGRPVIVSIGGGELTRLPGIHYGAQRFLARRLTTRLALRRARLVTAGSGYQLNLCRAHGLAAGKLRPAPLGIDTDRFTPPAAPPAAPVLVQAASLLPVKNQARLLHLLAAVKQRLPAVSLRLAGDGPLQAELRQLAQQLDVSHNVTWAGALPYPAMPHFFRQGTLYLQSSRHESQGMAVLEALACGLPAIGTPVGLLPEVGAASNVDGELVGRIVNQLDNQTDYANASAKARALAVQQYSLPVTTARFEQLYEMVNDE